MPVTRMVLHTVCQPGTKPRLVFQKFPLKLTQPSESKGSQIDEGHGEMYKQVKGKVWLGGEEKSLNPYAGVS